MAFLADETGGRFFHDQNFLDKPIAQAMRIEKGYYLLAYEPDDETFKSKKFNSIVVKVNLPGLKVSSRSGFLPLTDEARQPKKRTGSSELYEAILAPIPRPGLSLQLSAFFVNMPATGNVVRALIHMDGTQISFVDDADGLKKATLDVVAVTLNEKNEVIDEFTRTHDIKLPAAAMPYVIKNGLVYSTDVRVKKAGTYNFRVAVRDGISKNLGTAVQIVTVPDLKKAPIVVSGLALTGVDESGKFAIPGPVAIENAISLPESTAVPAVRRFTRGSIIAFPYTIYNARIDPTTSKPKLSIQISLFRDGKIVLEGKPTPLEPGVQTDWTRIKDYGRLRLDPNSVPGDYALQVIVTDLMAESRKAVTSQWIDFEVVE